MDVRTPLFSILEDMLDFADEQPPEKDQKGSGPSRAYVRDAKAMAATPADVVEYPNRYVFVVDMAGIRAGEIRVTVENDNVLVVSGERKHDHDDDDDQRGGKYLSMERRVGKFMRKFALPDNANMDKIHALCQDGVLTVTVEKLPPPEPKRAKTIEVKAA